MTKYVTVPSQSIFLVLRCAIRYEHLIGIIVISPFNTKTGQTPDFSTAIPQR
jgi:hypothetical protein